MFSIRAVPRRHAGKFDGSMFPMRAVFHVPMREKVPSLSNTG
jgi:hypothetical protein